MKDIARKIWKVILLPATLLTLGMGLAIGPIVTRLAKYRASL